MCTKKLRNYCNKLYNFEKPLTQYKCKWAKTFAKLKMFKFPIKATVQKFVQNLFAKMCNLLASVIAFQRAIKC